MDQPQSIATLRDGMEPRRIVKLVDGAGVVDPALGDGLELIALTVEGMAHHQKLHREWSDGR